MDAGSGDRDVTVDVLKRAGSAEELKEIVVQHDEQLTSDNRLTLTIRVVRQLIPLLLHLTAPVNQSIEILKAAQVMQPTATVGPLETC